MAVRPFGVRASVSDVDHMNVTSYAAPAVKNFVVIIVRAAAVLYGLAVTSALRLASDFGRACQGVRGARRGPGRVLCEPALRDLCVVVCGAYECTVTRALEHSCSARARPRAVSSRASGAAARRHASMWLLLFCALSTAPWIAAGTACNNAVNAMSAHAHARALPTPRWHSTWGIVVRRWTFLGVDCRVALRL